MVDNVVTPHRRSIRLGGYDYGQAGGYFITICTQDRRILLANIVDGRAQIYQAGEMVTEIWHSLPAHFPGLLLDAFVVMPNHLHAILFLTSCDSSDAQPGAAPHGTLPGTVGRVVQAFKSLTTRAYAEGVRHKGWPDLPGRLWQRDYYDRVIRSERELAAIRQYIEDNPASWPGDAEYAVGP